MSDKIIWNIIKHSPVEVKSQITVRYHDYCPTAVDSYWSWGSSTWRGRRRSDNIDRPPRLRHLWQLMSTRRVQSCEPQLNATAAAHNDSEKTVSKTPVFSVSSINRNHSLGNQYNKLRHLTETGLLTSRSDRINGRSVHEAVFEVPHACSFMGVTFLRYQQTYWLRETVSDTDRLMSLLTTLVIMNPSE